MPRDERQGVFVSYCRKDAEFVERLVQDPEQAQRVARYMAKPILALRRLAFDLAQGKVIYRYGKEDSERVEIDYLDFIARVTTHIPDKGQVMIRYYGLYSNAHRGKETKRGPTGPGVPIVQPPPATKASPGWRELIKKVYEVDPAGEPLCAQRLLCKPNTTIWSHHPSCSAKLPAQNSPKTLTSPQNRKTKFLRLRVYRPGPDHGREGVGSGCDCFR